MTACLKRCRESDFYVVLTPTSCRGGEPRPVSRLPKRAASSVEKNAARSKKRHSVGGSRLTAAQKTEGTGNGVDSGSTKLSEETTGD